MTWVPCVMSHLHSGEDAIDAAAGDAFSHGPVLVVLIVSNVIETGFVDIC